MIKTLKYITLSVFLILITVGLTGREEFKSYLLKGQLHRTAPYAAMETGSVQELLNMVRPASGMPGWKTRSGTTKHNTTAIASAEVKSLHAFYNKDSNTQYFFAQCNDKIYSAAGLPPSGLSNFASYPFYALESSTGGAFSATIGNDIVFAASGETPFVFSGIVYPNEILLDRNSGGTAYQSGWEELRNNDSGQNIAFITESTDFLYIISSKRLDTLYFSFISGLTNIISSGASVYSRQSGAWIHVLNIANTTSTGTTTFWQDGAISWTYSNLDETYLLPGSKVHGFVYRINPTVTMTAGMRIYQVRVAGDMQPLTAQWDGLWVPTIGVFKSTTTGYEDYTADVTDGSEYSYIDMSGASVMYLGFAQPVNAIQIQVSSSNNNLSTASSVSNYYWNISSSAFADVGLMDDSSSQNGKSLTRSGILQWDGKPITEGVRNFGGNPVQMYWYKLVWTANFDSENDLFVWDIGGAYKQDNILKQYEGVASYNGRAIFWPGKFYENGIDYSAEGKAHVLDGNDAGMTGGVLSGGVQFNYGVRTERRFVPPIFLTVPPIPAFFIAWAAASISFWGT